VVLVGGGGCLSIGALEFDNNSAKGVEWGDGAKENGVGLGAKEKHT